MESAEFEHPPLVEYHPLNGGVNLKQKRPSGRDVAGGEGGHFFVKWAN